jgi:hypothetical protein
MRETVDAHRHEGMVDQAVAAFENRLKAGR